MLLIAILCLVKTEKKARYVRFTRGFQYPAKGIYAEVLKVYLPNKTLKGGLRP